MKRKLFASSTSVTLPIFVQDTSSGTGGGLTGLVFNTAGLVAEYRRKGSAAWTAITLVTATLGTYASGGFIADGSLAGAYEVGVPDAAFAAGATAVYVRLYGATNMLAVLIEVELDAVNYQSANAFVTGVNGLAPPANWNLESISPGGKVAATLAASDVSGNVPADLQTIKTQTVAATAGYSFDNETTAQTRLGTIFSGATIVRANDASGNAVATAAAQTALLNAVNAITTNTARGKMVLPYWLVRPASGSVPYEIDVNVYNLQGQLETPDANPTIHARNPAGTSLDANLGSTTMTLVATGRYKVTYTVNASDTAQEVLFDAAWAVGGVAFGVTDATEVQDAELTATTAAIKAKTDLIATNAADGPAAATAQAGVATLLARVPGTVQPQTGDGYAVLTDAAFGLAKLVRSTTPANTLDVSPTGEAGLDFNNVKDATAAHTLTNIRVPNVTLADTVTTYTGNTPQSGDAFARLGAGGAGLTALGDARLANLDASVAGRMAAFTLPTNFAALSVSVGGLVALTSAEHALIAADAQTGLTAQGYTTARAEFLANLNVGGLVASHGDVVSLTMSNARAKTVVPYAMPLPASGSVAYEIDLLLYDLDGNNEAADALPTVTAKNAAGTDRSAALGNGGTMTLVSTGRYKVSYTVGSADAAEELVFTFTATVGGTARTDVNASAVVAAFAADFTASDRTSLLAVKAQTDALTFTGGNVNSAPQSNEPGVTTLLARVGTPAATVAADVAAVKAQADAVRAKTDNLPADPASQTAVLTPIALVKAKTDNLPADPASQATVLSAVTAAVAATAAAVWDTLTGTARATGSYGLALAAVKAVTDKLATMLQGSAPAAFTSAALANAPTGGLTGASPVTLTFHDAGGAPVPNVLMTVVGLGSVLSDSSGVAAFGLPNGTYTVTAAPVNLVVFPVTTVAVAGPTARTITGSAVAVPTAPSPSQTVCTGYTYGGDGLIAPGTTVYVALIDPAAAGDVWDRTFHPYTSDGTGLLAIPLRKGSRYAVSAVPGGQPAARFQTGTGSTTALPAVLGILGPA